MRLPQILVLIICYLAQFAEDATVTAVDSSTGGKLWSMPYTPTNVAVLEQPPAPAGRCDAELQVLCGAAKAKGVAACGMCAGTHAGALHSAGCSNNQIDSWCSDGAAASSQGSGGGGSGPTRAILLFGIEGQDGKPALTRARFFGTRLSLAPVPQGPVTVAGAWTCSGPASPPRVRGLPASRLLLQGRSPTNLQAGRPLLRTPPLQVAVQLSSKKQTGRTRR